MSRVDIGAVAAALADVVDDDVIARVVASDGDGASVAGRRAAAACLAALGVFGDVGRDDAGAPVFPGGVVGSIAHDDDVAVCVVARGNAANAGIGVDVEPALALPDEIVADVVGDDIAIVGGDLVVARAVFCAKEAVYKATWPVTKTFLEFVDVRISGDAPGGPQWTWEAKTITGARLRVKVCRAPRLLAWARLY